MKRGWCPSLYDPMESGDGLLVRVKPANATLTAHAASILADAARRHGNGAIDITSRANLQFRGLTPEGAAALLARFPDYRMFLEAAHKAGQKLILFASREFEEEWHRHVDTGFRIGDQPHFRLTDELDVGKDFDKAAIGILRAARADTF